MIIGIMYNNVSLIVYSISDMVKYCTGKDFNKLFISIDL